MKFIPNGVTRKFAHQIIVAKKNSPAVMFVSGVAGMIGTTVLASKATLKLEETLEKDLHKVEIAKQFVADPGTDYTEADAKKDIAKIKVRTVVSIGKLYAPAIVVGTVSIGLLTGSHIALTRRNVALTAAYAALEKSYNEYRRRVIDQYGEEEDRKLRFDYEACEIEDAKGKKVVVSVPTGTTSPYAKFFAQATSNSWSPTPDYNIIFIRAQQNYANQLLLARGHVLLNDVYDGLGLERTPAGAVVGWVLDKGGDNYIDFGVFENQLTTEVMDFAMGREEGVWLDFNVDGVVYDLI